MKFKQGDIVITDSEQLTYIFDKYAVYLSEGAAFHFVKVIGCPYSRRPFLLEEMSKYPSRVRLSK